MRSSFHMEQRRALVVDPGPDIAPEAGTLPPVLATIGEEEGGLTAHPTFDGRQLCLCVECQNSNSLADAFALNCPAAVRGLCVTVRCERCVPVEAGEHFVTCT